MNIKQGQNSHWTHGDEDFEKFSLITERILSRFLLMKGISIVEIFYRVDDRIQLKSKEHVFNIVIGAIPHKRDQHPMRTPNTLWGIDSDFQGCGNCNKLHEPSGEGLLIVDPASERAIAELVDNTLYILFNVANRSHLQNESRYALYEKILIETAFFGEQFPTLSDLLLPNTVLPSLEMLGILSQRYDVDTRKTLRIIAQAQNLNKQLYATKDVSPKAVKALTILMRIPEVKNVSIADGKMNILTHPMYATHPHTNKIHEFGEFQIEFVFGNRARASFQNITRSVELSNDYNQPGKYGHPHVQRRDGHWCHGEGSGIIELLKSYEFEAALLFAIKAIDTVNPAQDGNYSQVLRLFPVVEKHMDYPKNEAAPKDSDVREFANLLSNVVEDETESLKKDLLSLSAQIFVDQNKILQKSFVEKLMTYVEIGNKKRIQTLKDELLKIEQIEQVDSVTVSKNTLIVYTRELKSRDIETKRMYRTGPFTIEYDFTSGAINFTQNPANVKICKNENLHPIATNKSSLQLSDLCVSVSQLLGELSWQDAVQLTIEHLSKFVGSHLPDDILEVLRSE